PSNAIISPVGQVQVLDFGLARVNTEGDESQSFQSTPRGSTLSVGTLTGEFLGTPAYASPEQLAGQPITAASDQFSFCVALHHALEGVFPFPGENVSELIASIHGSAPQISSDRDVPKWLRQVLRRGLRAHASTRFQSMRALLDELRK